MAAVATTALSVRQWLMPAINRAANDGLRQRFKWLHGLSMLVTVWHIAATGWLLEKLVRRAGIPVFRAGPIPHRVCDAG